MKILYVGDLNQYARSYQRYRVMQELGYELIAHSTMPVPWKPGFDKSSIIERMMFKLGFPPDRTILNKTLIASARREDPSFIWIEKGLAIKAHTLKNLRELLPKIPFVFYSEDDMYARHNQSAYFRRCLPMYDIVFTTKSYNVDELTQIGAQRVEFIDQAYDQIAHRPLLVSESEKKRFGADVVFVGSFEENRAQQMLFLAENGISVRVWGNGWGESRNLHSKLLVENHPLYDDDYVKSLCSSKIALCFLRKENRDLQTSRTMEIPACGVFMLAEKTSEHQRLFESGKEVEFFESQEELLEKALYYLQHDIEREVIAKAGRNRCIRSGYSHHDRVKYMISIIRSNE